MKTSSQVILLVMLICVSGVLLAMSGSWLLKIPSLLVLCGALSYLASKADVEHRRHEELIRQRAAYEQLDQQAKLIIRTDLELHRTQEELDRKLASLIALHDLGQQLVVSLHPDEIYTKLSARLIASLGFSKGLIGIYQPDGTLRWQSTIGVPEPSLEPIRQLLIAQHWPEEVLANPSPRSFDLSNATEQALKLLELLGSQVMLIAGIKPHAGMAGFLLLARTGTSAGEWRGDEEVVSILTTQLGIAIENSTLYGEVWRSTQELESKIQERTRELADANAQLIRLNKAKSDFVSAVSHELRTPLAAIKGYASLLRGGQFGALEKAQLERLAKIEKHADLLTDFINNLLDIARIESGRVTMDRRPIDTLDFFASLLELLKPQLDAKHIRVSFDGHGVKQLYADPVHMPRVFINLLSNAIKYTPENGAIMVSLKRQGQDIATTIQDTGCGIDAKELPKLFQEFYRASHPINEQVKGTGLGLALVKRIIEAHAGWITVSSELGKGTTFTFAIPTDEPREPTTAHGDHSRS